MFRVTRVRKAGLEPWVDMMKAVQRIFGSFDRIRGYLVSLTGASLTLSFVVASEGCDRQSWIVLTAQSEGILKVEDPALDQMTYVLDIWL